jgi:hypothetical protein
VTKKKNSIEDNFNYILKDFVSDEDPKIIWHDHELGFKTIKENKISLPSDLHVVHPFIVFIIFVYLKNFKFSGKWEKIAWTIQIKFKGKPFLLTHRKFGFYIISNEEGEEVTSLGIEAMGKIKKAIPLAEALFKPFLKEKVNEGHFSLSNEFIKIKNKYEFFRFSALEEYKKLKKHNQLLKQKKTLNSFTKFYNQQIANTKAADYYASAMLDAYFSLLEHTLVLLAPFAKEIDYSKINIEEYIGTKWKEKYKMIFPISKDKVALQHMEKLYEIKEAFRNPLSHGYFFKNGNSFFVHLDQLGAIPVTMTKSNNSLTYSTVQIGQYNFSEICKTFDSFDKYLLKSTHTKFGMLYINSGLPIAYTKSFSEMYKTFMTSVRKFNEFIDYQSSLHDDAANMDW